MMKPLCLNCLVAGYCRNMRAAIVGEIAVRNTDFICDLRAFIATLGVSPDGWLEHASDLYRDYAGRIVDEHGIEIALEMEVLENAPREFWRTLCRPCVPGCRPRLRCENAAQYYQIIGTLIRAHYPQQAAMFGVRAANDNRKSA